MYRLHNINNSLSKAKYVSQCKILNQSVSCLYQNALSNGRQYSRYANDSEEEKSKLSVIKMMKQKIIGNKFLNSIGFGSICVSLMLYYLEKIRKDEREMEKVLEEMYSNIKEFISFYEAKENKNLDLHIIREVKQKIVNKIVFRKDLQKCIKKSFFVYHSADYINFLKMVLYANKEFLNHFYNTENVEKMIYFVITEILINNHEDLLKEDQCLQLSSGIYYQYARVLYFNHNIPEAEKYLKKVKDIISKHSYMQIEVKHLTYQIELKNLKQEIKNLSIQYNQKLNKFELLSDINKPKVEKLIKNYEDYIMKYEILKADNQLYVLNDYIEKKNLIKPTEYPKNQIMCQKALLMLYSANLLLKSALGIKDEDDIKHIANLIKELQSSLYSKESKNYNKIVHCFLLDTLDIVSKCIKYDDEFNKKAIKLMKGCITKIELRLNYESHAKNSLETSYCNTQFHCSQDKVDRTHESKILCEYMENCYTHYLDMFLVNDYNVIGETNNSCVSC